MKNKYLPFFSKITQLHIVIGVMAFVIYSPCLFSQAKTNNSAVGTEKNNFNKIVEIKMKEKAQFGDSLIVSLDYFSHKDTYEGDEGMAMIYLTASKGRISETIMLSAHGPDRKSGKYSYGTLKWNEYTFELKQYNYDIAIELIVSKNKRNEE